MELLTITAASQRVGLSVEHLRDLANSGKIKCLRASDQTRLFTIEELDRFIERRSKKAKARA